MIRKNSAFDDIDIKPTGRVHIVLRDRHGRVKEERRINNMVVTVGKNHIADQMAAKAEAAMSHMAVGTGTTAAAAAQTALVTELDRNALTSKTKTDNTVTYVGDWAAGDGTGAITEAGIFNSASAGTMLCRTTFAVINKGAGDSLTLTWILTFSS